MFFLAKDIGRYEIGFWVIAARGHRTPSFMCFDLQVKGKVRQETEDSQALAPHETMGYQQNN